MARTSKKILKSTLLSEMENTKIKRTYSVGIYARLSVDNHNSKNESIKTQIEIAKQYLKFQKDMTLYDCYIDLGKTGTSFQREEFQRLMQDIRFYKVDCIIVKDFSRFGRDYIEIGNYIEKIFPFLGVRFISVTDNFDSMKSEDTTINLNINLKNIINDMYTKDIAIRVKTAKKVRQEQGNYTGGLSPYGYQVQRIKEKRVLFLEPVSAKIVKEIFELYDEGRNLKDIICYLYEKKVHRPTEYHITGHVFCQDGENLLEWSKGTIKMLLTNPIYIGKLLKRELYRKDDIVEKNYYIRESNHEPLVDFALFCRIAERFKKQKLPYYSKKSLKDMPTKENMFKGILFCGKCGHTLERINKIKQSSDNDISYEYTYFCSYAKRIDTLRCINKCVTNDTLIFLLKEILGVEFGLKQLGARECIQWKKKEIEKERGYILKEIDKMKYKVESIDKQKSEYYLNYKIGKLSEENFIDKKLKKDKVLELLVECRKEAEKNLNSIERKLIQINYFLKALFEWKDAKLLDVQLIKIFVKRIVVYSNKRIKIEFYFHENELLTSIRKQV